MARKKIAKKATGRRSRKKNPVINLPEGRIEVIDLTPEWAELLLSNLHENQRKTRPSHLGRIERAITGGTYQWTGAPIVIDSNDRVIDGQHRLTAVVNTGVTLPNTLLVTAKQDGVLKVIDTTTAPRSLGDLFKIMGDQPVRHTVAAAMIYEGMGFNKRASRSLSKPEKYELIKNYEFPEEALALYNAGLRGVRVTSGPLAGALACVRKNPQLALTFFEAAFSNKPFIAKKDGDALEPCPQAALLANWMIQVRERIYDRGRGRTSGEEFMEEGAIKAIKAWNAFRMRRDIGKLVMPKDKKFPNPRK